MKAAKGMAEKAAAKLARSMDYPADTLLDIPSMHVTGRDSVVVEGCKGILMYDDKRITLDMGTFAISVYGRDIELQNLSKIELMISGRVSTISYDTKEENTG
jgi:YabP family.